VAPHFSSIKFLLITSKSPQNSIYFPEIFLNNFHATNGDVFESNLLKERGLPSKIKKMYGRVIQ
jgi:hypothetical protein